VHLSLDNGVAINNAIVLVGHDPNTYADWNGGDLPPKDSGGFGDAVAETDSAESTASSNSVTAIISIALLFAILEGGI